MKEGAFIIMIFTLGGITLPETWARRSWHHRHGLLTGCSRCPPGHWVSRECSRNSETECQPCRSGSYLPHNSYRRECYLCSRCGPGLYEAHPCLPERDTICDSCHTYRGPHNPNYLAKCTVYNLTESTPIASSVSTKHTHNGEIETVESRSVHHSQEVIVVMATSAICSSIFFGLSAMLVYYKWRRRQDWKIKYGIMYTAVETQDAVLL